MYPKYMAKEFKAILLKYHYCNPVKKSIKKALSETETLMLA